MRYGLCLQGEMVQTKFGIPAVAGRQMEVLSTAVLLATLSPPKPPRKAEWRSLMDQLSKISCEAYRSVRASPAPLLAKCRTSLNTPTYRKNPSAE